MTLNAVAENREQLDRALSVTLGREKEELLEKLGPDQLAGLRVWYFGGPAARNRDPREVPLPKIREFARHYTSVAA